MSITGYAFCVPTTGIVDNWSQKFNMIFYCGRMGKFPEFYNPGQLSQARPQKLINICKIAVVGTQNVYPVIFMPNYKQIG